MQAITITKTIENETFDRPTSRSRLNHQLVSQSLWSIIFTFPLPAQSIHPLPWSSPHGNNIPVPTIPLALKLSGETWAWGIPSVSNTSVMSKEWTLKTGPGVPMWALGWQVMAGGGGGSLPQAFLPRWRQVAWPSLQAERTHTLPFHTHPHNLN